MLRLVCLAIAANATAGCSNDANGGDANPTPVAEVQEALCPDGQQQSPIDLPASVPRSDLPDLLFDYHETFPAIVNTGGTVQYEYAAGSQLTVDGATFELAQFHFHAPSEHSVAGDHAPMELHLVHRGANGLLVVGVMLEEGAHNATLDTAQWSDLPPDTHTRVESSIAPFNARDLLPGGPTYRYAGSLTAPPCTGEVSWVVFQQRLELDAAQIAAFTQLYDENARPVQPLDGRTIAFGD